MIIIVKEFVINFLYQVSHDVLSMKLRETSRPAT